MRTQGPAVGQAVGRAPQAQGAEEQRGGVGEPPHQNPPHPDFNNPRSNWNLWTAWQAEAKREGKHMPVPLAKPEIGQPDKPDPRITADIWRMKQAEKQTASAPGAMSKRYAQNTQQMNDGMSMSDVLNGAAPIAESVLPGHPNPVGNAPAQVMQGIGTYTGLRKAQEKQNQVLQAVPPTKLPRHLRSYGYVVGDIWRGEKTWERVQQEMLDDGQSPESFNELYQLILPELEALDDYAIQQGNKTIQRGRFRR